jgi:hypothetical protein
VLGMLCCLFANCEHKDRTFQTDDHTRNPPTELTRPPPPPPKKVLSADWCKYNDCIIATGSIDKTIKVNELIRWLVLDCGGGCTVALSVWLMMHERNRLRPTATRLATAIQPTAGVGCPVASKGARHAHGTQVGRPGRCLLAVCDEGVVHVLSLSTLTHPHHQPYPQHPTLPPPTPPPTPPKLRRAPRPLLAPRRIRHRVEFLRHEREALGLAGGRFAAAAELGPPQ